MAIMKAHLNLLPASLQRRFLLRLRLRQWGVVWGIAAAALVGYYAFESQRLSSQRQTLAVWRQRAATIQSVEDAVRENRKALRQLRQKMAAYGHLESEQCGYQLIGLVSQGIGACAEPIQIQDLTFQRALVTEANAVEQKADQPKQPPIVKETRRLELKGIAASNLAVAQFVSSLRDCRVFQQVELRASETKDPKLGDRRSFHVECSF
jgi:hypothetical protein